MLPYNLRFKILQGCDKVIEISHSLISFYSLINYRFKKSEPTTAITDLGENSLLSMEKNKDSGTEGKPNHAFELIVKIKWDTFAKLCEICIAEEIFQTLLEWKKNLLVPKAGKTFRPTISLLIYSCLKYYRKSQNE